MLQLILSRFQFSVGAVRLMMTLTSETSKTHQNKLAKAAQLCVLTKSDAIHDSMHDDGSKIPSNSLPGSKIIMVSLLKTSEFN